MRLTPADAARGAWRALRLATTLLRWRLQVPALARATDRQRAEWRQRHCRRVLRILHVEVAVHGPVPLQGLLVGNHTGYLDVLVLGALAPAFFVSKAEVADWPVAGPLTRAAGTVYVWRERMRSTAAAMRRMRQLMDAGELVVLFPEGTSSGGDAVLPFHPPLFEPAMRHGGSAAAVAVAYQVPPRCGPASTRVAYWGTMHLPLHLLQLVCVPVVRAAVCFGAAPVHGGDRQALAAAAHCSVAGLLRSAHAALDCPPAVEETAPVASLSRQR